MIRSQDEQAGEPLQALIPEHGWQPHRQTRRSALLGCTASAVSWGIGTGRGGQAHAASASDIARDYDRYAPSYDDLDGGGAASALGFDALRQELLASARGQVVEVAVGTGLNLQYYPWGPGGVTGLQALDLSSGMLEQATARARNSPFLSSKPITFQQADATQLPLPDASADCVVDTFSLCVIPDPLAALTQMARVVRPEGQGGRVLLLEHSKSDNPLLGAYQDLTASAVAASAKGCVWNQDIPALLRAAGLTPVKMSRHVGGTIVLVEAVQRGGA